MKKIVVSSLFLLVTLIVSAQNRNFGGPSTTYQMQQNAQRATQNNTYQRQQFDQRNRDLQRQRELRNPNTPYPTRTTTTAQPATPKPKKEKKAKKAKKVQTTAADKPKEEVK
mgnify:FL=1|jgi:hypothetical protein